MIEGLPIWIDALFIFTFFLTIFLCYKANGNSSILLLGLLLWSLIQSSLGFVGFYQILEGMPPRFALVLLPTTLFIFYGLLPKQRKWIVEHRNLQYSTLLHVVRLPVELVLYGLYMYEMIPELMTFEGRNYDIVMGLSAPLVALLLFKNSIRERLLFLWNAIGLLFVLFILVNGILSAELPFQQFAFDQPNRAVTYFPYILLPATIVPIVIWTHLSDMMILKSRIKSVK